MNVSQFARALGRRGGLARARRLSREEKKRIASQGGRAKALSRHAVRRLEDNFIYLDIMEALKKDVNSRGS